MATSPNGDEALEVVKTDGADAYGSSVSMSYPAALGLVSLVSDQQTDVVMNVYAPAAGETVRMRLESSTPTDNVYIETDVVTTQTGWQTLRFDFDDLTDTSPARDSAAYYDKSLRCTPVSVTLGQTRHTSSMTYVSLTRCQSL